MKSFAIVGAGAVGCYYGARLAEAGNDVRFLLRSDFDHVSAHGMEIQSIHGDFKLTDVTCSQSPGEIGKVDVVIVAWKTTSNHLFEEVIRPMLREDSIVLTLQNGLGNIEALSAIFGADRVMGALCFVCINRMSPGDIRHTGGGPIAMGEVTPGVTDRLKELAGIFEEAKVGCQIAADLGEAQWRKLVWNIPFNGLCITEGGIDTRVLLELPEGDSRVRALMAEVILAANALGYPIEDDYAEVQIKRTYPMGSYRPSSMIDFVEGREVEVEAIWGEPLRRAREAGASVPLIANLYDTIRSLTSKA
ncbi:2-dehydropantoate 2-reductase [Verrucomicrobiaceae bacterium 227]